ncbi:MAG: adenylate/guanylate cyclase domain-containing protein [Geminicoccaceae bacterium]
MIVQQLESERLISWIQLVILLLFTVLYAIAPKTAPADAAITPVPIALAAYLLFTLARLVLAYRGLLRRWFLSLSAVVDMTLLMLLIWSFHIQYAQPPAFYLKAPTWGYVFIFIALRALSFEPRYVLITGIAAMTGWAALVAYALLAAPGMPVTRDFVQYMSSPTVLLGAEFDKMITIALVTAILAIALHRGRRLLIESATDKEAARELARFFTPEIALQITTAERPLRPGQGQHCEAAVLQVDLKGFTRVAATLTPDQAVGLLTEYHARVVPVIRRHGGSVDKFMGDGIMATFGAARPSTTYAADALRTVLNLVEEAEAWIAGGTPAEEPLPQADDAAPSSHGDDGTPAAQPAPEPGGAERLAISMAVASGELVVGAVGDLDRLEYTVIGNPVNLAAKLEKHTRIENVTALTTTATLLRARQQGFVGHNFGPPHFCRIAGLAEPVPAIILAQ